MRYFVKLSYKGTHFAGWQSQPNTITVQSCIEQAFSTILREPIEVVGCGRTDTGVHSLDYVLHFDTNVPIPIDFLHRANHLVGKDIAFRKIKRVKKDKHARFDAVSRSYKYIIDLYKNPFAQDSAWYYSPAQKVSIDDLNEVAFLLLKYSEFAPFCKSNAQNETMICFITAAKWTYSQVENRLYFDITANRFLRGMIRLIVGTCMNVALGKLTLEEVKTALDNQTPLPKSWSVPPQGLYLCRILY